MFDLFRFWFGAALRILRDRRGLMLENLTLRQQLAVLKRKHPRPRLGPLDKLFWVLVRRLWSQWKEALFLVQPETVVRWHRAGFKLYWDMPCKVRKRLGGGRRISKQICDLIFQMVAENPSWGAPRIHGELLMLGFEVSETTISRWMRRAPKSPQPTKHWLAFLRNHREAIAAMDFFTVPTLTFKANTGWQGAFSGKSSGDLPAALGRVASPLRSGCLNRLWVSIDLFERTAQVWAHAVGSEQAQRIRPPHTATSGSGARERSCSMHRTWCILDCGETQLVKSFFMPPEHVHLELVSYRGERQGLERTGCQRPRRESRVPGWALSSVG